MFPLYKNDGQPYKPLNDLQINARQIFCEKISSQEYQLIDNDCLCGNKNKDIVVSEKDFLGIGIAHILCLKCGLIRVEKYLEPKALENFYKHEFRILVQGQRQEGSETFWGHYEQVG